MNEFEKEVVRSQLGGEKKALRALKAIYKKALEDVCERLEISNGKIDILLSEIDKTDDVTLSVLQSQIYRRDFQQNIRKQLEALLSDLAYSEYGSIAEYLRSSYENGFVGTLYSLNMSGVPVNVPISAELVTRAMYINSKISKGLYTRLGEDVEMLRKRIANSVSRGIASGAPYAEIARNIRLDGRISVRRSMTIARTEGNRVYSEASLDSGMRAKQKSGADLVKQWDSTLDSKTRPHHRQLDGQVRELSEDFEVAGKRASAPLHFGVPEEDINCRCVALIKPRWDVDSAFTKRDNQSGELLEFKGVSDYEEFKKRYWENVDKSKKSGIMRVGSDNVALENQRYGRNKNTLVNKTYIESGEYKRKFDTATDNSDVNKTLYDCAKTALKHRSGTAFEDMYWIDSDTGKVIHSVVDSTDERAIIYTEKIKSVVRNNHGLITLHTHPSSLPPSASDINSCFKNKYKTGFVACHNGRIFGYTSNEIINERIYNIYIQNYINEGLGEFDAQLKALEKLSQSIDIQIWEVG